MSVSSPDHWPMLLAVSQTDLATAALFYIYAGATAAAALGVVVSRNIVRTAVFLLFTLAGVAGLYFLLDSEFLAAVQLVVYAGGTLILIVFGVMLTSKSPFSRFEPTRVEAIVAIVAGVVLLSALLAGIAQTTFAAHPLEPAAEYPMDRLGQSFLGDYLAPFELASVLLLAVMIGAAYLAKGRRRERDPAGPKI